MVEMQIKNGHGSSLYKDLWITNMLAPALTITFNLLRQEDLLLKYNLRMVEKYRKHQHHKT